MTILAQNMPDLIAGTLPDLGRMKFQQVYQQLQEFEVYGKLLKKGRVDIQDNGIACHRNIMIADATSDAAHMGYMDEDNTNIQDVMRTLKVNWVHVVTKWAMVYQTDVLMNSGAAEIFSVMKTRRCKAMIDLAQVLEDAYFGAVPDASDETNPRALKYWFVQNATTGFTGLAPSGYTLVGNLNPSLLSRWRNFAGTYTGVVSKKGAIKTLRKAARECGWVTPVKVPDYTKGAGEKYRLFVNGTTMEEFEEVGEDQNENLGKDVASMDGTIVFKKHPIVWIPKLDADSNNPIYFQNNDTMKLAVLKGDFLRETPPKTHAPKQHNLFETFIDTTYAPVCVDRRRNAVLYKV